MDQQNPYSAPQTNDLGVPVAQQGGLQNLGQQSRLANLNGARWALIFAALFLILPQAYEMTRMKESVRDGVVAEFKKQGQVPDPVQLEQFVNNFTFYGYLIDVVLIAIGFALIGLGIFISKLPVAAPVTGLIIFSLYILFLALFLPQGILFLWWLKIIIFASLFKGIQAGKAYQRERQNEMLATT